MGSLDLTPAEPHIHGRNVILDLSGSPMVYPGHPLVLATAIMKVFGTFDEANAPTGHGWCAALGDDRIPGAGDHVGAAMRTLTVGAEGEGVDAMVAYARRYWEDGQAGGHQRNVAAGAAQARAIEPAFRALAQKWLLAAETAVEA